MLPGGCLTSCSMHGPQPHGAPGAARTADAGEGWRCLIRPSGEAPSGGSSPGAYPNSSDSTAGSTRHRPTSSSAAWGIARISSYSAVASCSAAGQECFSPDAHSQEPSCPPGRRPATCEQAPGHGGGRELAPTERPEPHHMSP